MRQPTDDETAATSGTAGTAGPAGAVGAVGRSTRSPRSASKRGASRALPREATGDLDSPALPSFTVHDAPSDVPATGTVPVTLPIVEPSDRHGGTGLVRHDAPLEESKIDADAAKIVRRLERSGFQAYLVGGCVRDLLLGSRPKDFDIATSARPEDVRSLFRNCRIIGRRFRLAHVVFGSKIIEVATFRRSPQTETPVDRVDPTDVDGAGSVEDDAELGVDEDLLIRSDNVFGEAHEDALRRDFTINALFYDLDRRQVLDWCGGMEDIQRRTIHTIGDPTVRFREDPVRILRAVKFAARLDLGIAPAVYDAMVMNREELAKAARPRLSEEILRLLRGGAAHRSLWLLWEVGAMAMLLPELSTFLDDDEASPGASKRFWKRIDVLDQRTKAGPVDDLVYWTTLLYEPMAEALAGSKDPGATLTDFLEPVVARIALPRRAADGIRRIVGLLPKLAKGLDGKLSRLGRADVALQALDVLEIDFTARGKSTANVDKLRREIAPAAEAARAEGRANRSRRGGRSRR